MRHWAVVTTVVVMGCSSLVWGQGRTTSRMARAVGEGRSWFLGWSVTTTVTGSGSGKPHESPRFPLNQESSARPPVIA